MNWSFRVVTARDWYEHPDGLFRIQVPASWSAQPPDPSSGAAEVFLRGEDGNVGVAILSQTRLVDNTPESARAILDQVVADRSDYAGFTLLEPVADRAVDGHHAAAAFFSHFLMGPAYQQLFVVVAAEWDAAFTIVGFMNTPDSVAWRPIMNATLDSFDVLPARPPDWLTHPAAHFRLRVPLFSTAAGNATFGGETFDGVVHFDPDAVFLVASEARRVSGTSEAAREVLQATLDELSTLPGFRIVEPVSEITVDGHAAARVDFVTEPSGFIRMRQLLVIVVGPEWGTVWALLATIPEVEVSRFLPTAEFLVASFDVLPAPAGSGALEVTVAIVVVGAVAAVAAGLVVWTLRRRRGPPTLHQGPGGANNGPPSQP